VAARAPRLRSPLRGYLPELAIGGAALLYGSTFTVVQDALDHASASGFNVARFALGAVVLLPFARRRGWRGPRPRPGDGPRALVAGGVALGVVAAVAYQCQNVGLEHTSTSNAAFITGLFAVFTPVVEAVWFRRFPRRGIVAAIALAMVGLFLLTGADLGLSFGDAIVLVAAVGFGVWFVILGEVAPRFDITSITTVQLATVALCSLPVAATEGFGTFDGGVWLAVLLTGIGCSALAFSLSTWAQRTIDPSRASLLTLLEPIVAGVVGWFVGERLGAAGYAGAALILAGILVAERGTHRAGRPGVQPVTSAPDVLDPPVK
jgi:drug/metabolite transporter (DMT)-like permease